MGVSENEVLLDDELIEKDFNDALDDLQKSLNPDSEELKKAGKKPPRAEDEPAEADEEESEDEDEDEDEEDYEKSVSDIVSEDPEAAAAMEVSQFLGQLVKAIDESVTQVFDRVRKVEKMVKSQGNMLAQTAKLEKSTSDMLKKIGGQPVQSKSVKRLEKSRFEGEDGTKEFDNATVLIKSRDWVKTRKIDLNEAGMIESRINKGRLGRVNDRLDQKVAALMREEG